MIEYEENRYKYTDIYWKCNYIIVTYGYITVCRETTFSEVVLQKRKSSDIYGLEYVDLYNISEEFLNNLKNFCMR